MASTFDLNQIDIMETRLGDVATAITSLLSGGVAEYSLNTGQSIQRVTKLDLKNLNTMYDSIYNQLTILQLRCGVITAHRLVIPGY